MAAPTTTTTSSSATTHPADSAVCLRATVVYDPHLHHYISSGWDLGELLSQRVHTTTSTFVPFALSVASSRTEKDGGAPYRIEALELRRAALRALLLFGRVDCPERRRDDGNGVEEAEVALEAALDRWVPLTHLSVYGGKRPPPAVSSTPDSSAAPSPQLDPSAVLVYGDEESSEAAAASGIAPQGPSPQRLPANVASQWPVLIPTTPNTAAVSLVLSLVKDAHTWRKLRRDARRASNDTRDQQTGISAPSAIFVSDDDVLFTQWLQSKQALRLQWRHLHADEAAVASPAPANTLPGGDVHTTAACVALPSDTSSSSSASEAEDAQLHSKAPPVTRSDSADAAARRAAVLAAIDRRRAK